MLHPRQSKDIFYFDPDSSQDSDPASSPAEASHVSCHSDDSDNIHCDEIMAPTVLQVVSSNTRSRSWYCTYDWYLNNYFSQEIDILRILRADFIDKKPDKIGRAHV